MRSQGAALDLSGEGRNGLQVSERGRSSYRFSSSVWNIDWTDLNGTTECSDVRVAYGSFGRVWPFVRENFDRIFEEDAKSSRFLSRGMTAARLRYYEQHADVFEFTELDRIVGTLICTPNDWSTYYIRFVAILPEYSRRCIFQSFLPILFERLRKAGVERVEADTSPSNLAFTHIMNKFGFNVTGTILSERWGTLTRFTKFLDVEAESIFLRQFCTGVKYQNRGTPIALSERRSS